jgi:uncharacterized delta-60 repeat protein
MTVGRIKFGVVAVVAVVVIGGSALPAAAAPSSFDPTFSGDGKAVVDPSGAYDPVYSMALQEDGKVVVVGRAGGAGGRMFALRFTEGGALDTTFSGDGKAFVDFGPQDDFANAVAVTPDGDILLMGGAGNGRRLAVARLNGNGTPDTAFSGDGKVTYDYEVRTNGADFAAAGVLQADGSIVMTGQSGANTAVWRLTEDGDRDLTFGNNGRRTRSFAPTLDVGLDVALDDDENILVVGSTVSDDSAGAKTIVARFTTTGGNDSSFSGDGSATLDVVAGRYEDATEVSIQPDGAIVVAGEAGANLGLLRFTDAGALDPSFSGDGRVRVNRPGPREWLSGLDLQADGRIVVGGGQVINNFYEPLLGRYNANGTVDTTFASGAGFVNRSLSARDDYISELEVRDDGRIVAAAFVDQARKVGVLRLQGG